ncbi:dihydrodipicolinate reductase C-terminal domain-containing protein [Candidatus Synchoanobacter obligatus]|uniref:Dihydrodipicolinate reductase C-terminal domain-containing protein n=1 Tax=Candidatus Synchoanobacter obligatus TaxID=2919597 RepID=A0ABT1L7K1_9GAMM|nr:dihydrodipicolinate reductase C-terminal domain-containing protein [Candidatus Synchoanobacter obligatus]MCP8352303.1 hypothetical protein [Candidatus Synchoanobacter obligatus]
MDIKTILISGIQGKLGSVIHQRLASTYHIIGHRRQDTLNTLIHETKPCLIIDVSSAQCIHQHMRVYHQHQIPTLIGASGLSPDEAMQHTKMATFPLLIVPNFSLSFHAFLNQAIILNKQFPSCQIIETHHQSKVDQPSATSLYIAKALNNPPIISKRISTYTAQHDIIFSSGHDTISISHQLSSHQAFIPGVLKSIKTLEHLNGGQIWL